MKYALRDKKEMKDTDLTGINWIPRGWSVLKLKQLTDRPFQYGLNESAIDNVDGDPRYIRITDITTSGSLRKDTVKTMSSEKARGYILQDGDLLFARSGATAGKPFMYREFDGVSCFAGYLIRFVPNKDKLFPRFLDFVSQSAYYESWKNSIFIQATIQNISADKYKEFLIPIPSTDDQKRIADFLDEKTVVIDEVVKKKKKQIELLKEKRDALITQAVTKGLNSNVKMKDSGVEWIGEIPEGWNLVRLRRVVSLNPSKQESKHISEDSDVTFLPMTKVSSKGTFDKEVVSKKNDVATGFTYFRNGDVITAKITPCFENGKGALVNDLVNGIGFGSTEFTVIRPSSSINGTYLYYLVHSEMFRKSGGPWMYGSAGQQRVPDRFIKEFQAPLPSIEEQEKIVMQLDRGLNLLDRSIKTIQKSIKLIQEYRSSLISHVVTGKIVV
ncbi:restriction endonuclease subunit S [Candidatus Uhrbacteria bacterium]|nr:restriction endonuclease subunit S [Candidatus Uhrbacteria bacterium]